MPIRTGKQFLEALHDDRQIFIDGERVRDVAADKRLAGAARSLAELYDMQHDPALHQRMTFASPSISRSSGGTWGALRKISIASSQSTVPSVGQRCESRSLALS